ncbi:hypothetical protein BC629DRAFT_1441075 [Irpex lacteus]|nr:hypothetical protein BC629DRAFT_1441075 [Irpex lacteus]
MCSYCGVLASFFFLQAAILAFQFTLNAPALRHKVPVRQGVITKTVRAVVGGSGHTNVRQLPTQVGTTLWETIRTEEHRTLKLLKNPGQSGVKSPQESSSPLARITREPRSLVLLLPLINGSRSGESCTEDQEDCKIFRRVGMQTVLSKTGKDGDVGVLVMVYLYNISTI